MASHILDSQFLKDLYGTPEMRAVFDDMHLLQKWLDAEVALAQAEAEMGIIPEAAASEITRRAHAGQLAHHALILKPSLEDALAYLGLVWCVCGIKFRP